MITVYETTQAALAADACGARTLTTLEAALELTGKATRDVNGRPCFYGTPMRRVDDYVVGVVHELPGGVDGFGSPIVEGLLADRNAIKAAK